MVAHGGLIIIFKVWFCARLAGQKRVGFRRPGLRGREGSVGFYEYQMEFHLA